MIGVGDDVRGEARGYDLQTRAVGGVRGSISR
jgi:hypothetical protein